MLFFVYSTSSTEALSAEEVLNAFLLSISIFVYPFSLSLHLASCFHVQLAAKEEERQLRRDLQSTRHEIKQGSEALGTRYSLQVGADH